jgi:hypothetical protein
MYHRMPEKLINSGAVGWGTVLQTGRSRFRFPMVSLEFFIYIILLAALWREIHVTRHNTPIHNIISTAPQLSISQEALGTLPSQWTYAIRFPHAPLVFCMPNSSDLHYTVRKIIVGPYTPWHSLTCNIPECPLCLFFLVSNLLKYEGSSVKRNYIYILYNYTVVIGC